MGRGRPPRPQNTEDGEIKIRDSSSDLSCESNSSLVFSSSESPVTSPASVEDENGDRDHRVGRGHGQGRVEERCN